MTEQETIDPRWKTIRALLKGQSDYLAQMEFLVSRFEGDIADRSPNDEGAHVRAREIVLDVTEALALSSQDPALRWNRAPILSTLGRHAEAARDYLDAAARFANTSPSDEVTGDESDWADTAMFHACREYILGGQYASAASLASRLRVDYRREIEDELWRLVESESP